MAKEVETKVLDIDTKSLRKKLKSLKAVKISKLTLKVSWFREVGIKEGEDLWFLRVRSYNNKKHEVTWKAKSNITGNSRNHKEINFFIDEPEQIADLFEEIGLEKYAYQEKVRTSYKLRNWRFDIDEYPNMPPFLEIEGQSDEHISKAVNMLGIENNKRWNDGERTLIQEIYNLDWYNMKFK